MFDDDQYEFVIYDGANIEWARTYGSDRERALDEARHYKHQEEGATIYEVKYTRIE